MHPDISAYARSRKGGLTIRQRSAIDLVVSGKNDTQTARQLNLARETVTRWRLYDPVFQAALEAGRSEVWDSARDGLRFLMPMAIAVLLEALQNPLQKFRTALALLRLGKLPLDLDAPRTTEEIINDRVKQRMKSKKEVHQLDQYHVKPGFFESVEQQYRKATEEEIAEIALGDVPGDPEAARSHPITQDHVGESGVGEVGAAPAGMAPSPPTPLPRSGGEGSIQSHAITQDHVGESGVGEVGAAPAGMAPSPPTPLPRSGGEGSIESHSITQDHAGASGVGEVGAAPAGMAPSPPTPLPRSGGEGSIESHSITHDHAGASGVGEVGPRAGMAPSPPTPLPRSGGEGNIESHAITQDHAGETGVGEVGAAQAGATSSPPSRSGGEGSQASPESRTITQDHVRPSATSSVIRSRRGFVPDATSPLVQAARRPIGKRQGRRPR